MPALLHHDAVILDRHHRQPFPRTRHSVFAALAGTDADIRRAAADVIARAYWGPVIALLELRWNMDRAAAEDVAQDFFADAFEKGWFLRYDGTRGRFRTFLRACVDRFATNAAKSEARLKRGGGIPHESLDAADVAGASHSDGLDERIHDEWVRGVLSIALDAMRDACRDAGKSAQLAMFEAYHVDDCIDEERPTYRDLALRFDLAETQVTNYLAWARREFRHHVLDALRSLAADDNEFREDARDLLGARRS